MNTLVKQTSRAKSLTKYDPQKAVKNIAVLEMAEKHYAKAKDSEKLMAAIRSKLQAQAEFVRWWDVLGPGAHHGGDRKSAGRSRYQIGHLDPDQWKLTVSRWRPRLSTPEKFEQTVTQVCAKYPKLLEFATTAHVGHNSGENEWYTPAEYIEAARRVMNDGIDLDPATTETANDVVQAAQIFTVDTDGLRREWTGRVWLNPPYAQPLIEEFAKKLACHVRAQELEAAIVLVNNATETSWFQMMAELADGICFKRGRIKFWGPHGNEGSPLQGQAFLYFGTEVEAFIREFRQFGFIVVRP